MALTDETLLRYADGTLSSAEAHEVESQLESDDLGVERLRFLHVGGAALASARHHDLATAPVANAIAVIRRDEARQPVRPPARRRIPLEERLRPWRAAAGIALFAVGLALGMTFAPGSLEPSGETTAGGWIDKVVDYQSLYSRETVEPVEFYPKQLQEIEARLAAALGAPLQIPDLSDASLEFREGRQLDYNGKTIIQLVYLPYPAGNPIAICAIKKPVDDMEPRYLTQHGMGVVQWARDGVEFLLVGEQARETLEEAALTAMPRL